jgi:hypothetical protein
MAVTRLADAATGAAAAVLTARPESAIAASTTVTSSKVAGIVTICYFNTCVFVRICVDESIFATITKLYTSSHLIVCASTDSAICTAAIFKSIAQNITPLVAAASACPTSIAFFSRIKLAARNIEPIRQVWCCGKKLLDSLENAVLLLLQGGAKTSKWYLKNTGLKWSALRPAVQQRWPA